MKSMARQNKLVDSHLGDDAGHPIFTLGISSFGIRVCFGKTNCQNLPVLKNIGGKLSFTKFPELLESEIPVLFQYFSSTKRRIFE